MAGIPLATAFVRVRPAVDRSQFKRETDTAIRGAGLGKAGAQHGKLFGLGFVKAAAAGFALLGGAAIFSRMISGAEESAKVTGLVTAALKSTGGAAKVTRKHIEALANAMMAKTGVDDEAIKSGDAMLLTFTNIRNEAGKNNKIFDRASSVLLDMTAAMTGGNVTSEAMRKQAIQLGKALNDPVKGMSALRRVGVTFTKQQQDQVAAMVKSGNVLGAQKLILRELGKEFGGAAAASATTSQRLKTALGELAEQGGTLLLPVFQKVAQVLATKVVPAVSALMTWIQGSSAGARGLREAFATLMGVLQTAGQWLGKIAKFLMGSSTWAGILRSAIGGLALGIAAVVAVTKIWTIVQTALNVVLTANPIGLVVIALAALAAGLYYAWTHSATFRKIVIGAFTAVKNVVMDVVRWFTGTFVPFFTRTIPAAFQAVLSWVRRNWPLILSLLTGPIGGAAIYIIRHWKAIKDGAVSAFNATVGFIRGVPGRILAIFRNAGAWLWWRGYWLIQGFWNGIKAIWNTVIGWFKAVPGKILRALGIASPPGWAIAAGRHIMNGILQGLVARFGPVRDWVSNVAGTIGGTVASAGNVMLGRQMAAAYGWTGAQFRALYNLWQGESGWNERARNAQSGAYGIPQALPASKMASAGRDWLTNPATQIRWGLRYILERYGSPVAAYGAWLSRSPHWYGRGGVITEPVLGFGRSGRMYGFAERGPETVTPGRGGTAYTIIQNLAPGVSKAEVGKGLVDAIRAYEAGNGRTWRTP